MSERRALDELVAGFGKSSSAGHGTPAHQRKGECLAIGCHALLLPYALFCVECWQKCPSDLKRCIEKHHRPRKPPSKVLSKWLQMAMDELLELKMTGHYRPRDGEFMWDDEPQAPIGVDEPLFPNDAVPASGAPEKRER